MKYVNLIWWKKVCTNTHFTKELIKELYQDFGKYFSWDYLLEDDKVSNEIIFDVYKYFDDWDWAYIYNNQNKFPKKMILLKFPRKNIKYISILIK